MNRKRASEEDTLVAWDDLLDAIKRVECALPFQMSAAIAHLGKERERFHALMSGRPSPTLSPEGSGNE